MRAQTLTAQQMKGARTCIVVVMLVLALFVLVLLAGHPIMDLGWSEPPSLAYVLLIYTPVIALCVLAYRRLR